MLQDSYDEWLASFDPKEKDIDLILVSEQRKREALEKFDAKARRIYRLAQSVGGVVKWIESKREAFEHDPRRRLVIEYSISHFCALEEYEKCIDLQKGIDYLNKHDIGITRW